jgi:thiol-disulfide isomerase/thioredoxin
MTTDTLAIGAPLPSFAALPGVDGRSVGSGDLAGAQAVVVVFSCNHCPYVQAYEERMIAFDTAYRPRGVRFLAINANETEHYPDDDFAHMCTRARDRGYTFPYVRDEKQEVATAFGATHTPEFFLFGRGPDGVLRLAYHGKMDDQYQNAADVKEAYLRDAVDAVLAGAPVRMAETHSIGCTIKWR